jgi:heterotetrameric sarcosine oxidase delta subunit
MRIPCPFCGERDAQEFSYLGDATKDASRGLDADPQAMADYVYLRDNPAGSHREFLVPRCRLPRWLVLTRDTRTHAIAADEPARDARAAPRGESGMKALRPRLDGAARGTTVPAAAGGLIDRSRPLRFRFDGRTSWDERATRLPRPCSPTACASRRSFKYHRPRGCSRRPERTERAGRAAHGARREPNTRATTVELFEVSRRLAEPLALAAVRPALGLRPVLAAAARRLLLQDLHVAGELLGKALRALDPPAPPASAARPGGGPRPLRKGDAFCDVLVIGGGPAASRRRSRGRTGARVIVCDEDFLLGGRLLAERREIDGRRRRRVVATTLAELESLPEVRVMPRTSVFGVYDHGTYGAVERVNDHVPVPRRTRAPQRAWRIVASGPCWPRARPNGRSSFSGNDRPGIMLAGACAAISTASGDARAKRPPSSPPRRRVAHGPT